jgi:hypothetical protein
MTPSANQEGTYGGQVLRTTALHETAPFDVGAASWSIKLAQVHPEGDEFMDWPSLQPQK